MNKKRLLLFILLCFMPSLVFANSGTDDFPLGIALFMEAFVSIHMTLFVLIPLSNLFGGNNPKYLLKILFIGRIVILILCDIFITPMIAIVDFFAVFVGAFLIVPICSAIKKKDPYQKNDRSKIYNEEYQEQNFKQKERDIVLRCSFCGKISPLNSDVCDGCGTSFSKDDIIKDW